MVLESVPPLVSGSNTLMSSTGFSEFVSVNPAHDLNGGGILAADPPQICGKARVRNERDCGDLKIRDCRDLFFFFFLEADRNL